MRSDVVQFGLRHASLMLFGLLVLLLGALEPRFLTLNNAVNVAVQSAPVGVVAVGMTFVLLTAGVDLSVGAIMFVGAAVAAKLVLGGQSPVLALVAMVACGGVLGAFNGYLVTRAGLVPFIATLSLLFMGRGFALWLTQTRAMNLPEWFLHLGATRIVGVPMPLLVLLGMVVAGQWVLSLTPFGRQLHAVGESRENARRAGVPVRRLLFVVYVISGLCAAVGGLLALAQLGAVSPKFGENYEFKAIAAAVLGGTSLFGGRGAVWPGTLLGVLLIQTLESGLVMLNADPYLYPLVTAGVIFIAVLLDSTRKAYGASGPRRPGIVPERA